MDDWTRNLLDRKLKLERSVRSQRRATAEHFAGARVARYEPLVGAFGFRDASDRHVLAAAISCGSRYIVTDNLTDFPDEILARFANEAIARSCPRWPSSSRIWHSDHRLMTTIASTSRILL